MTVEFDQQIAFGKLTLAGQQDGTDDCFAALVERQSRFVFQVAFSVLRNAHDAEDVVQETFLKLYRTGSWRNMNEERAFLATVSWRIAVERLPRLSKAAPAVERPEPGANPEEALLTADWNATVHRLIDALPDELRQPLALSTVNELKSHEIAEVMGIPDGTVRTRLMRARQILKHKLEALLAGRHAK